MCLQGQLRWWCAQRLLRQLLHLHCHLHNGWTAELRHPYCHAEWIASHAALIPWHLRTLHSKCLRIADCRTRHLCTTHGSSFHQSSRRLTDVIFAYQVVLGLCSVCKRLLIHGGWRLAQCVHEHDNVTQLNNALRVLSHNSFHDCLLASTQCSTGCTLLARPRPVMPP